MIGNPDGQIDSAVERRKLRLPDDVPPAQRFDPRLAGFRMPAPGVSVKVAPVTTPLPATDEDIAFAPLTHLSHWIATGQLSSTRLTGISLDRIAAIGPRLECRAAVTPDLVLAEAAAAGSSPPASATGCGWRRPRRSETPRCGRPWRSGGAPRKATARHQIG